MFKSIKGWLLGFIEALNIALDTILVYSGRLRRWWGWQRSSGKQIAWVRLDAIGDFLLWIEAAKAFVNHYRSKQFSCVLICNEINHPLAISMQLWDEVIPVARRSFQFNPWYRARLLCHLQERRFDIMIHPVISRELAFGDAVVRVAGAMERIGSRNDGAIIGTLGGDLNRGDSWYTVLHPLIKEEEKARRQIVHELMRNADFVQACGVPFRGSGVTYIDPHSSSAHRRWPSPYYVIAPTAGNTRRRWPIERFIELISRIRATTAIDCAVIGQAHEFSPVEHRALCDSKLVDHDLIGEKTSLLDLTGLLGNANWVIALDSAIAHWSAATRVRCVVIVGGGHYKRFLPYPQEIASQVGQQVVVHPMPCFYCNWNCIYDQSIGDTQTYPCISTITVDDVWQNVKHLLKQERS